MPGHKNIDPALRLVCGGILWGISSLMTASLFLSLAGDDTVRQGAVLGLAVGLEGAKILSWRMGGWARLLSVSLILLSMMGSLGTALETVRSYRRAQLATVSTVEPAARADSLRTLDRQTDTLLTRLERLPPDYTSAARDLNGELERLRNARSEVVGDIERFQQGAQTSSVQASVFDLIAEVARVPTHTVLLVVLLFLATNVEVAALVLAGHSVGRSGPLGKSSNPDLPETHKAFLKVAMDGAPLPFLHGRDVTARRLGIRFYEAKKIVRDLIGLGLVEVRGKRLVLRRD